MVRIMILQLVILCFGTANFLPLFTTSNQETRTLRWTTTSDLKNASCAIDLDLKKIYNYTVKNSELENYIGKNEIPFAFLNYKILFAI